MLDVIIGRHTWNCQICTHIHTGYTHTCTPKKKLDRKKNREGGSGRQETRKRQRTKRKGRKRRRKMREKGREEKTKKRKEGEGWV